MVRSESSTDSPPRCDVCDNHRVGDCCFHCGWPAAPAVDGARGLDDIPDPTVPEAKAVYEGAAAGSDHDQQTDSGFPTATVNELRSLNTVAAEPLADAGYQASNVGISVTTVTAWKRKRHHVTDTDLYDYLLRDAVVADAYFWAAYHDYETLAAFVEAVLEDGAHRSSEENVARTYRWLVDEIDAPRQLVDVQAAITRWSA